jgi:hypothetical protein
LRSGCCPDPEPDADGKAGRHPIRSREYKAATDEHGNHQSAGIERDVPWVAIALVVNAIRVLERIVPHGHLLFDHNAHDLFNGRPGAGSLKATAMRRRIEEFVSWANEEASTHHLAGQTIPPDPNGKIGTSRFRRSLAWHIARRPNGLVALAVQRAIRAAAAAPTFVGSVITAASARRLLANEDAMLYDNPHALLLCDYKRDRALCHRDGVKETPSLDHCVPGCGNIVRTDHHATLLRAHARPLGRPAAHQRRPAPVLCRWPRSQPHYPERGSRMSPAHDERGRIRAAMDRILSGCPKRSNGALTIVALALEADVPRNALTQRHTDLKNEFYQRVRKHGGGASEIEARLRADLAKLKKTIANKNAELAQLRADVPALVRVVNQLTLENQQLRQAQASPGGTLVAFPSRLPPRPAG